MRIVFDPAKDEANRAKHGVSLGEFNGFDPGTVTQVDDRRDYGEVRYRSYGTIAGIPYVLVWTRADEATRLISLRRCHRKELVRHGRT